MRPILHRTAIPKRACATARAAVLVRGREVDAARRIGRRARGPSGLARGPHARRAHAALVVEASSVAGAAVHGVVAHRRAAIRRAAAAPPPFGADALAPDAARSRSALAPALAAVVVVVVRSGARRAARARRAVAYAVVAVGPRPLADPAAAAAVLRVARRVDAPSVADLAAADALVLDADPYVAADRRAARPAVERRRRSIGRGRRVDVRRSASFVCDRSVAGGGGRRARDQRDEDRERDSRVHTDTQWLPRTTATFTPQRRVTYPGRARASRA